MEGMVQGWKEGGMDRKNKWKGIMDEWIGRKSKGIKG